MRTFFTSDHHFYHNNVIKYCNRPFDTVEAMNEAMIKNWNETVGTEDVVYCLGDFAMAFRPVEIFSPRLNGIKYLVPGNHDFCHPYHKRSRKADQREIWKQKYIDNGWIVLPEQISLEIEGIGTINLCHLPYTLTHQSDDKYKKYRPIDDGNWLLCGHVHDAWKIVDNTINVGVDVWDYKPVCLQQIKEIILSYRNNKDIDGQ